MAYLLLFFLLPGAAGQLEQRYALLPSREVKAVNAFCDNPPPVDWKLRLHFVFYGGTCFWQAL